MKLSAWIASFIAFSSWIFSSQTHASALATTSVPLVSGRLVLPAQGDWRWSNSCHSRSTPCFSGTWKKSQGLAYLFGTSFSPSAKPFNFPEYCKGVHQLQGKLGVPGQSTEPLRIGKNKKGQTYCFWSNGDEKNYLWKAGKNLISFTFSPGISGSSGSGSLSEKETFRRAVEAYMREVSFVEK